MKWIKDINGMYVNADKILKIGVVHNVETGAYKDVEIRDKLGNVYMRRKYYKHCVVRACTETNADAYYLYIHRYEPTDAKTEEIAADFCQEYLDALIKNLSC